MDAALLSNGNTHHDLALIQTTDGTKPVNGRGGHLQIPKGRGIQAGPNHFGWELESEQALVDAYNRAVAVGLNIHRVVDHTVSRSVYVFDPDGYLHEFYSDSVKDWWTCFDGHIECREMAANWGPNAEPAATDPRYHTKPEIKRVAQALIHPLRLTHTVLMTRYSDRMVAFYAELAGLKVTYSSADGGLVCLAGPATGYAFDVALFRQPPGTPQSVHHYGYQVADETELDAAEAALAGAGIELERRIDNAAKRSFLIRDPDGMGLEFYVAHKPDPAAAAAERPYLI
jgi:catechol 2,3-dioxygenase